MAKSNIQIARRDVLRAAGLGAVAVAASSVLPSESFATPAKADALLKKLTGGAAAKSGRVTIKLPEIAENGRTVPLSVTVDSPMTSKDYVKAIHVLSEGNPTPAVASFNLSASSGKAAVSTRIRLGKTQNVIAAAVMNDGSVYVAKKKIKVTIGGCGG
ncbi:MAG: thiosulfate oxidation carrier protein SoxY [Rhodospirillales bacterium]|jgi:sulfur-oxidizing protein SoxY